MRIFFLIGGAFIGYLLCLFFKWRKRKSYEKWEAKNKTIRKK